VENLSSANRQEMKTRKNKILNENDFMNKSFSVELIEKFIQNKSKINPNVSNKIKNHFMKEFLKSVAYGPSIQTIELAGLLLKLN
jgi:hypothetical protein